ncbi:unnamed protein product [Bursaphelenchus okinawaensis]|uniref:Uncharacterized protein n=1 Tax=Bursaphelenchus okinawaensis TaxID=465554 RepID=A0A811KZ31_9BILA|nr:unnamed protein product [Bursaphelenchus okinawaensis]CAG9114615.1 unnamed protein product [Bursaphelenchus okinawaensis]
MRPSCLSPSSRIRLAADFQRYSTSDDDSGCVMDEYAWVPSGCKPDMVHTYFASLPHDKVPYVNSAGEKWRISQLKRQLPPQDSDPGYCRELSEAECQQLVQFEAGRKRQCLGKGVIRPHLPFDNQRQYCHQCKQAFTPDDMVIEAPERFGNRAFWHPQCFVCVECTELLVDLIYFKHNDNVFCGRHHAEQLKPRCYGCDELIFNEECTEAEGRMWHMKHFVCCGCSCQLGGLRYVVKDSDPYCISCYNQLPQALCCSRCGQEIEASEPRITQNELNWHTDERCFSCTGCAKNLLGCKKYCIINGGLYCGLNGCEKRLLMAKTGHDTSLNPLREWDIEGGFDVDEEELAGFSGHSGTGTHCSSRSGTGTNCSAQSGSGNECGNKNGTRTRSRGHNSPASTNSGDISPSGTRCRKISPTCTTCRRESPNNGSNHCQNQMIVTKQYQHDQMVPHGTPSSYGLQTPCNGATVPQYGKAPTPRQNYRKNMKNFNNNLPCPNVISTQNGMNNRDLPQRQQNHAMPSTSNGSNSPTTPYGQPTTPYLINTPYNHTAIPYNQNSKNIPYDQNITTPSNMNSKSTPNNQTFNPAYLRPPGPPPPRSPPLPPQNSFTPPENIYETVTDTKPRRFRRRKVVYDESDWESESSSSSWNDRSINVRTHKNRRSLSMDGCTAKLNHLEECCDDLEEVSLKNKRRNKRQQNFYSGMPPNVTRRSSYTTTSESDSEDEIYMGKYDDIQTPKRRQFRTSYQPVDSVKRRGPKQLNARRIKNKSHSNCIVS